MHLKEKSPDEFNLIKQALFLALKSQNHFLQNNLKLQEEYYLLTSTIIIKEFNLDPNDIGLFTELINAYNQQYN